MDRSRRWTRIGFAVTLLTTLLAGFERLDAGKPRQAALFFLGAAVGRIVYARRRRLESRAALAASATPGPSAPVPGDRSAAEPPGDA